MKSSILKVSTIVLVLMLALLCVAIVFAPMSNITYAADGEQEETEDNTTSAKAIGAAIVVGLAAAAGAIGMGIAIAKSNDSISRQPEASGKITSNMMLGLVFIETAIIYALIVAILLIFVL